MVSRRRLTPEEASWALCKGPRADTPIPDDHHQVVALRRLLCRPVGEPEPHDYENRHFAALLILFSQFTPERVAEASRKITDKALLALEDRR
jgi:hypothetical protein